MNIPQPIILDIEVSENWKWKIQKIQKKKPKPKIEKDEKQTTHGNKRFPSSTKSQNVSRVGDSVFSGNWIV
jgi:hypothetical protein